MFEQQLVARNPLAARTRPPALVPLAPAHLVAARVEEAGRAAGIVRADSRHLGHAGEEDFVGLRVADAQGLVVVVLAQVHVAAAVQEAVPLVARRHHEGHGLHRHAVEAVDHVRQVGRLPGAGAEARFGIAGEAVAADGIERDEVHPRRIDEALEEVVENGRRNGLAVVRRRRQLEVKETVREARPVDDRDGARRRRAGVPRGEVKRVHQRPRAVHQPRRVRRDEVDAVRAHGEGVAVGPHAVEVAHEPEARACGLARWRVGAHEDDRQPVRCRERTPPEARRARGEPADGHVGPRPEALRRGEAREREGRRAGTEDARLGEEPEVVHPDLGRGRGTSRVAEDERDGLQRDVAAAAGHADVEGVQALRVERALRAREAAGAHAHDVVAPVRAEADDVAVGAEGGPAAHQRQRAERARRERQLHVRQEAVRAGDGVGDARVKGLAEREAPH